MKIVVNPDNLVVDETWQIFNKVRAIIENDNNEFIISKEGGKYIFPGGKCEMNESKIDAIQREIKEETGIYMDKTDFRKILELETFYKDFYDYRTDSIKPRYTKTIYYYAKFKNKIDFTNMKLTEGEIKENFKIFYVKKEELLKILKENHSDAKNGKFFDEENKIVLDIIF